MDNHFVLCGFFSEYNREILGAVFGLVFGWIIWFLSAFWKYIKNRMLYHSYNGSYEVYLKGNPLNNIQYKMTIKVSGSTFMVDGHSYRDGDKLDEIILGEIEMDKSFWNYGRGYYRHDPSDRRYTRFGFYEIQLDYGNILAHQIIKSVDEKGIGVDRSAAYIWLKVKK